MATIEYINKRIEGKTKEIEKLEKKLSRIEKAESTGWEVNPYYYSERDKTYTVKDLEAARSALAKYQAELAAAQEKENSRNVKAILDFLEIWKTNVKQFYINQFPKYLKALEEFRKEESKNCEWWNRERRSCTPEERKAIEDDFRKYKANFSQHWNFILSYVDRVFDKSSYTYKLVFNTEKLDKELKAEANAKYDDIIERTNEITGKITDASNLEVGAKGELNGYIIGERGTAKVNTIGAGGYNIQCFHFRTLVHSI